MLPDNNGCERDIRTTKLKQKYPAAFGLSPAPANSARLIRQPRTPRQSRDSGMALVLIWENLDWWRRARMGLAVAVEFAEPVLSRVG